jgi:hypothetical protein
MTKKLLGLLVIALLCAAVASASTAAEPCGSAGLANPNGSNSTTTLTGSANACTSFTLPATTVLTDVYITFKNDWQLGLTGTDTLTYSYTITGFNIGSETSTVTGTGQFGSGSPVGSNNGCTANGDIVTCDDPGLSVTGSFNAIGITINAVWSAGGLDVNGSEGTTINAFYTYATPGVPEPASMLMIGGGLIGLALAGRRKWRA